MQVGVIHVVRYSVRLGREVVYRLTYSISEGPSPETNRWFLVGQEEQAWQDVEEFKKQQSLQ